MRATRKLRRWPVVFALGCVSVTGLVGCGPTTTAAGTYQLLRTDERPRAISFLGIDSERTLASVRSGVGRVQLVFFDVGAVTAQQQLEVLRGVRDDLTGSGVRLLRVPLDSEQLRSHDVLYRGRLTADPRVTDLGKRVNRLAVVGFSYTEIIDVQGRVAARLIGTSEPERLHATLRRLLGT